LEEFVQLRILFLFAIIILFGNYSSVSAQVDSVLGQLSNSAAESFANGISGDGRFVVFESRGDLATVNPRNADNNREIFLFDYAQRRIFQITDTKPLRTDTAGTYVFSNIKVEISNIRPVISNDGRWLAFGSNAAPPAVPVAGNVNPGSFDAESYGTGTTVNPLTTDGNLEIWMYQIPAYTAADLTTGEELPLTDLSGGSFIRVTNTPASLNPRPGTASIGPFVADDNHDVSIDDNGNVIAFASTRDLVTNGNSGANANDEIFTYVRNNAAIQQITQTPYGTISSPIYNLAPTISGSGGRVAFVSNANGPFNNSPTTNSDRNDEVFYANLSAGSVTGTPVQLTNTVRTNAGDILNIWNFGRRMSRDGNFIAFDSYGTLETTGGSNQTSFATYLYNLTSSPSPLPERIGLRSDADAGAAGGDVRRYPGFTDYDVNGVPTTLVLSTRMNIKADGTIPATAADGLNPNPARPVQIYSAPIANSTTTPRVFTRLTKFPTPFSFIASTQAIPSNSVNRIAFNLALTEQGTGNFDLQSEVFYILQKAVVQNVGGRFSFATGATRIPVSASPVPTPTPTATPSPTPTPTTTPSPTPTPTPQTPFAVQGVSPGMLVIMTYDSASLPRATPRIAVGSLARSFTLPIELSGVTVTINGVAAGLKQIGSREITLVVPPGLSAANEGTVYPVVINNNGFVQKGDITVVAARPDIFTAPAVSIPTFPFNGIRTRIFNVTNTVPIREPFTATTFKYRGSKRVPTVLRLYLTGVNNVNAGSFTIRIGSTTITSVLSAAVLREPGVYSVDFALPATINGTGDQPIVVSVSTGGVVYNSRLDDTTSFVYIL
jgi:uncharacterized protein (TIGR03437 family)